MEQTERPAVIVTGGAQGIGRAFALRLARDGWRVTIADRNVPKAGTVCDEIRAAGGTAEAVATDVAEEAGCNAAVDFALRTFGRIDGLINNAAIADMIRKPFWEIDVAEWDTIASINTRGVWLMMKAVAGPMRAQMSGSIVNMSSNTFSSGRSGMLHYVASKGAVVGITRGAARELGEFNIRVNCIMPGSVLTEVPRVSGSDPERVRSLLLNQSLHRQETPGDLVGTAAFLLSDDARFMTGQSLTVDGGYSFI